MLSAIHITEWRQHNYPPLPFLLKLIGLSFPLFMRLCLVVPNPSPFFVGGPVLSLPTPLLTGRHSWPFPYAVHLGILSSPLTTHPLQKGQNLSIWLVAWLIWVREHDSSLLTPSPLWPPSFLIFCLPPLPPLRVVTSAPRWNSNLLKHATWFS